jgi:hypothetical protein
MASLFEKLKHPQAPYYILLSLFLLHVLVMWPGGMTPDSHGQYTMAVTGMYRDDNPPMMSFVWRYLNMIYAGPGLILLLHLSFFYIALYIFMSTFKNQKIQSFYLLLPLIPSVVVYSGMIWKDVAFAYSYLLLTAILTHFTILKKPFSPAAGIVIFLVLFYGTAVKFQAQYCAPLILVWVAYIYNDTKFNLKTFSHIIVLNFIFFISLSSFHAVLVPQAGNSHFWQRVKIYDLAGISYETNKPLFPEFIKKPNFSMEKIRKNFNSQRVDDLFSDEGGLLPEGRDADQRQQLWNYWFKTVLQYPLFYLKHRFCNLSYIVLSVPGLGKFTGSPVFWTPKLIMPHTPPSFASPTFINLFKIFGTLFIAPFLAILLGIFYIILAIKALPYHKAAIPLLFINLISLDMVIMLLFFSMAGTPRYIYISVCLTHASHALAFLCWKALSQKRQAARTF